jgi:hypothetical protein
MRLLPTDGSHIHKLDWTGLCACGFTLAPQRRVVHARTHTGVGTGPVYVTVDIGVNRCMIVQKSCNVADVGEAIGVLETAIASLREVEQRREMQRRGDKDRRASERKDRGRRVSDLRLD